MLRLQFTGTTPRHRVRPSVISPLSSESNHNSALSDRTKTFESKRSQPTFDHLFELPPFRPSYSLLVDRFFAYFTRGNHIEIQILTIYVYTNRSATMFQARVYDSTQIAQKDTTI